MDGELRSAQLLYQDARYEAAQAWLAELEPRASDMHTPELARFYYLRGMTAFRLGQLDDALHYLVLAEQLSAQHANALPPSWQPVMERALQDIMPTGPSPHARNPARPESG